MWYIEIRIHNYNMGNQISNNVTTVNVKCLCGYITKDIRHIGFKYPDIPGLYSLCGGCYDFNFPCSQPTYIIASEVGYASSFISHVDNTRSILFTP